ncbi:motility associated factor glycosyltransferase family protein [Paenibacillus nanensis]|nr:6-hydroxymethylpterin diphosphokinase MptE-like protein [Paenibacillus nanensis]
MEQDNAITSTMEDIKLFLPKLVEACETVGNLFYEPVTQETWQQFGEIVEGIDDLYKTLRAIEYEQNKPSNYHFYEDAIGQGIHNISDKFKTLNILVDEENFTAAGDFIHYEMIAVFRRLLQQLGEPLLDQKQRFHLNMEFLKETFPKVYDYLSTFPYEDNGNSVILSRNGLPILCVGTSGKTVHLHSSYDPIHEADRWVAQLSDKLKNKSTILMYGVGCGYFVLRYASVYPQHSLYLYEPDEQVMLAALRAIDFRELCKSLNIAGFTVGEAAQQKSEMLEYVSFQREPEIVVFPVYRRLKAEEMHAFFQELKSIVTKNANVVHNYNKFGLNWTRNSMYNLSKLLMTPSIAGLQGAFKGVTAVIVGAGPSLEHDIEILRQLKKHALIFAAGSTIQSLLHYGIKPHLIFSIDGSEANVSVFDHLDIKEIPLMFAPMLHYKIIEDRDDHLLHAYIKDDTTTTYFMSLTDEAPVFLPTHSVTGTAIQAAVFMGCEEIVLAGQDLSYPNEKVYAEGSKHFSDDILGYIIGQSVLQVENVSGTMNRTSQSMLDTLKDIEGILARFPGVRFVNTSRLGANIKHTVFRYMEEVLQSVNAKTIDDHIFIQAIADLPLYKDEKLKQVYSQLERLPSEMQECTKHLKNIVRQIGLLEEASRTKPNKCLSLIASIDSSWSEITSNICFKGLFLRACAGELKRFEVELPKLIAAKTILEQTAFYVKFMLPLAQSMFELCPDLQEIISESKSRVEGIDRFSRS